MNHRKVSRFVLPALCLLLFAPLGSAQFRGSIRGTVTDPSGRAVSPATVTLENKDTGQKMVSTSDVNGIYQFNALPPAPYRITIEAPGFKTKVLDQVQMIPEQPNTLNLQLELGQVQQTVTVSGTTPTLDTETATLSGTISSNQIQHMPSFGRDVMQLVQLAPGMTGDGAQGGGGGAANLPGTQGPGATGGNGGIFQTENGPQALAVGQQYETNGISIDGISTASAVWGGTTIVTPSEDSVESVKVVSNTYDAENARFSGAQIEVTSKSGSNEFHGSFFYTAHRPGLNAYQRFNGAGNAVLKDTNLFNQLGGSIGGPIWKNKIFFFFNLETINEPNSAVTANGWYDTPAFDALAPPGSIAATYLSFPGNGVINQGINPSTCTDVGLVEGVNCRTIPGQGLNLGSPLTTPLGTQDPTWSSPTSPGVGSGLSNVADIANYRTVSNVTTSKYQYNGRLDWNVTERDHIAFAIYWVPQSSTFLNGAARQYNLFHHNQINEAYSVIWNHTFTPDFLNEFRTNVAGWNWNEITSNPQQPVGLPLDNIDQIGSLGLNGQNSIQPFGAAIGSILNQWTGTVKDVATKIIGGHSIKFGGDFTRLFYLNECTGCGVPNYNFFNLWDFLNDAPQQERGNFNPNTGVPTINKQDDRENLWGLFVQDDFKVRRNLTLNLGLRWSYFGSLYDTQNTLFTAFPGYASTFLTGLVVRPANAWTPQPTNYGPQVGFAWSPSFFKDKLVLRGGYGLNYNQEEIALSANVQENPGLVVSPTFVIPTPNAPNPGIVYAIASNVHSLTSYPANPNTISTFGPNGLPTTGTVNVAIFPRAFPTMRVNHYSFDAQYDLGHNWIAMLGYQGSLSRDLNFHENPNAAPAALGYPLNPQIGGGDYWSMSGYGHYNAMIADLKHQFSQHFQAETTFTWAKCMDTSSGPYYEQPYPYNLNLDYGRCDYNINKAFKFFGTWQPVFFRGNNWLEKIFGGWSLSGILNVHSGFPWSPVVNVVGGSLYCSTCGYTTLFPAAYLGGAGSSTSNDQFKTGSNYPKGGSAYFLVPAYTPYNTGYGSALPQSPGVARNSLTGPYYRDVDLTLMKGFGLPKMPVLGENARIEIRVDAYNIFNLLNFNPTSISNNIAASNFGQATSALASRVVTIGGRFVF
ncbi:MAG: TonB-dependent receptor [Acidobacteriaceae bacterium]|nr:TonB-dependent receptor [Acidobacteriaceae bacterium]